MLIKTLAPTALRRRTLLALLPAPALLLAGCGFKLRGVQQFAFGSLYIAAPPNSPLARELRRTLQGAGDTVQVLTEPAQQTQAEAILEVLSEQHERTVVGLNASGQVRELQLRLRLRFKLRTPTGDVDAQEVGREHLRDTISELLESSEVISQAVADGTLAVVGANYRLLEGRAEPDVIVGLGTAL